MFTETGQPTLTRQQRRAQERRLAKATRTYIPLEPYQNRIRFNDLTAPAYRNVCQRLMDYGNKLSRAHCDGLMFQAGVFTLKAQGKLPGRHQITLAPGVGKTEGVIGWLKALIDQGHYHVGVAVAASKVEELAVIKRKLLEVGVPTACVGLRHEYRHDPEIAERIRNGESVPDGYASEPSEGHDRQVLLVTHARIMTSKADTYRLYRGQPRMVIYDEALVKSQAKALPLSEIRIALNILQERHRAKVRLEDCKKGSCADAAAYLQDCHQAIEAAHAKVEAGRGPQVFTLPDTTECQEFLASLPRDPALGILRTLLEIAHHQLKVVNQANGFGGVLTYEIVIPDLLDNVAILDASYPVRDLIRRDRGIVPGEKDPDVRQAFAPYLDIASMDLSKIKRYDRVEVKQMRVPGGRGAMTEDFGFGADRKTARREDGNVCKEIADVVGDIPTDQSILIFTFKDRGPEDKFSATIRNALTKAGVDCWAKTPEGHPRINVKTWGQETAINDFAHCSHVILAGVIRRNRLELEGAVMGQEDSLDKPVTSQDVTQADHGEVLHCIYQALNRGQCRVMEIGQAKPMTAWIMHKNRDIEKPLKWLMPGLRWGKWKPNHFDLFEGSTEDVADKITEALCNPADCSKKENCLERPAVFAEDLNKISFRALRSALGMAKEQPNFVPDRTWADGRKLADARVADRWDREGQSYVRITAEWLGFTPEP